MKILFGFLFAALMALHVQGAVLTVQELSEEPYTEVLEDSDQVDGDEVINRNGDLFLIFSNASVAALGSAAATIVASASSFNVPGLGSLTKSDLVIIINSGARRLVGPLPRVWNSSSANVVISYVGVASDSLSVKAFRLKPSLLR